MRFVHSANVGNFRRCQTLAPGFDARSGRHVGTAAKRGVLGYLIEEPIAVLSPGWARRPNSESSDSRTPLLRRSRRSKKPRSALEAVLVVWETHLMTRHPKARADLPPLRIVRCGPVQVPLPRYQSPGAAGLDLHAAIQVTVRLKPGQRELFPTGLKLAIPPGYEGQVRPRSSLALKHGISVVNTPGTIDSDYRGEVGILLINHSGQEVSIEPLERIAQLVLQRAEQHPIECVGELDATERGEGGYGSTGRR